MDCHPLSSRHLISIHIFKTLIQRRDCNRRRSPSSEFHSKYAAGGNDPLPHPHHWDVRVRPGPGFQGCVRPLRRLLEPDQSKVGEPLGRSDTPALPPHRRRRRRTSPLTLADRGCAPTALQCNCSVACPPITRNIEKST